MPIHWRANTGSRFIKQKPARQHHELLAQNPAPTNTVNEKKPPATSKTDNPQIAPNAMAANRQCLQDENCADGFFCDNGQCIPIQTETNYLYLYYRSGDRRFTEILGIYWHRRGEQEGYRILFPLYWHFWNPEERSQVLFPFYFRFDNSAEKITNIVVPPFQFRQTPTEKNYRFWPLFFWTDYGPRGSGITVLPLFHRAREGTRTAMILPLFLSGYNRDPARGYSQGLLGGLYYWHTEKQESSKALIPLFYHHSAPERSFTWAMPLNFAWRRGEKRNLLLFPFFYRSQHPQQTLALNLVPPLIYYRERQESYLFALPFFYHHRNPSQSLFIGGPFYRSYHQDNDSGTWGIAPLLFTKSSAAQSYQILFPIFWRFRTPEKHFVLLGPLFHHRTKTQVTSGIFPAMLYHHNHQEGNRISFFLPLFYYDSVQNYQHSHIITPLFLYERDQNAGVKHWGLLAPPIYSRRDTERNIDLLFPLFMRWHNKVERSTTWVWGGLFVFNRDPEGQSQTFFPIFWRFKDAQSGAVTSILFPLYWRHRRADGSHFNILFPFYYKRSGAAFSSGLIPLFYVGKSPTHRYAVLFPIFWYVKNAQASTHVLGPFFYRTSSKGWQAGLAPIFFAGRNQGNSHQVLFPLFWHFSSAREDYNTVVAGPFFWTRSRKSHAVGLVPLFAAGESNGVQFQTILPPLFYRSQNKQTGASKLLAGLYYSSRSADTSTKVFFPLAYYKKSANSTTTAFLPFFYHRNQPQSRLLITPLGGFRQRTGPDNRLDGIIGPFVFHCSPQTRGFALLPLFIHWSNPAENTRTSVLFPLGVRHISPQQNALVWFPFFWRFTSPAERSLVAFPIYWRLRQRAGMNADVVFPLFWSFRSAQRKLHIAGPAFYHRSSDKVQAGVFPLAFYSRNKQRSAFSLLPLIFYRHQFEEGRRTWIFGPTYFKKYSDGYSAGILPLFFIKNTPEQHYAILLPVFWHSADRQTGSRITFVGPFFYQRGFDNQAVGIAPLLYHSWNSIGGRTTFALPLFYYHKEIGQSAIYTPLFGYDRSMTRTQWYAGLFFQRRSAASAIDLFAPIFLRHRNNLTGMTNIFALPIYHGHWNAESSFHLFFPLVWRQKSIDHSSTVVLPFVWDFQNKYVSRTTVIFPLVLRHRDHVAQSTSYLTPPGLWIRNRPKATDAILFPIFWHFGGEKRSSTIGFPLYWDFKRGQNRTTIAFPLFWRFENAEEKSYIVLNNYYSRNKKNGTYNYLFVPLLQVQRKRPGDLKVEFIAGLAGYERIGRNRLLTIFFYTFPLKPTSSKTLSSFGGYKKVTWIDP